MPDDRPKPLADVLRAAGVDPQQPTPQQIVQLARNFYRLQRERRRQRRSRPWPNSITRGMRR